MTTPHTTDPDPFAHVKVGDPDPYLGQDEDAPICEARATSAAFPFVCTRPSHPESWQHIAVGGRVVHVWGGSKPARTAKATAAKVRMAHEKRAEYLRDRGWTVYDPGNLPTRDQVAAVALAAHARWSEGLRQRPLTEFVINQLHDAGMLHWVGPGPA